MVFTTRRVLGILEVVMGFGTVCLGCTEHVACGGGEEQDQLHPYQLGRGSIDQRSHHRHRHRRR
ncbi:MAG: hypothetical protein WKF60_13975, partial [Ilumatobacter sp.]